MLVQLTTEIALNLLTVGCPVKEIHFKLKFALQVTLIELITIRIFEVILKLF
jgi:hypothetical protein